MGGLEFAGYALLGAVAGLLAGLLGIGGGVVVVPGLLWLFHAGGLPPERLTQLAVATSLAAIVLTAAVSTAAHHRRRAVAWRLVCRLAPGLVAGAVLGAWLADRLSSDALRRVFGVFELLVAWHLWRARPDATGEPGTKDAVGESAHALAPSSGTRPRSISGSSVGSSPDSVRPSLMTAAGGVIGTLSSLVGIGGGTLTTPFLLWCGVGLRRAIATSAACGLPIALAGTLAHVAAGWDDVTPAADGAYWGYYWGYLYWPALLVLAPSAMVTAPWGVRLAHGLPLDFLRRLFALLLAVVGLGLLR